MKKSGYIAIVGRPNVGKSTLLNTIIGEKVAIVSSKPQTTRNRILGIETRGDSQFIFVDTPGIHRPQNSLGDYMVKTANAAMKDADAVILMADPQKEIGPVEEKVIDYLKASRVPAVLALNKIDQCTKEQVMASLAAYSARHSFYAFVPISAKNGKGVDTLMDECSRFLPEGDWIYPEDMYTDQPLRQMASEIIREKILRTLDKEVPHGIAVVIEDFQEEENLVSIRAEIFCEKESHKGILVGKGGRELKLVGSYARADLEKMLGKKVYLNLWVKVKENWRDSLQIVANFGYKNENNP